MFTFRLFILMPDKTTFCGTLNNDELTSQASTHDMDTCPPQAQHTVVSSQLYDDLRGDSASALDSASEASDLTDSSASAREKLRKKATKRRRAQVERWPRLLVLSVEAGTVVECQLESSKGKTVTFKFDIHDMFPRDIANNLVVTNLLAEQHADVFVEQVQDIVQQLKEHPTACLPCLTNWCPPTREAGEGVERASWVVPGVAGAPGQALPAQLQQVAGTGRLVPSPVEEQAPQFPATATAPPAHHPPHHNPPPALRRPSALQMQQQQQQQQPVVTVAPVVAIPASPAMAPGTPVIMPGTVPVVPVAVVQPPPPVVKIAAVPIPLAAAAAAVPQGEVRTPVQVFPDANQVHTPPTYGATPHALSSENSFSESDPGSSAQLPTQAYAVVTDLSHLQQRLVELTTPSGPPHAPPQQQQQQAAAAAARCTGAGGHPAI
ncbi:hypothetical protein HPB48_007226 [Haemaphysalis longicornis]|uniref:Serine/threonine-protein kinase WNK CCTL2 domain-containing protein n=1 Tax=Haemaphysalis longicornis TaxID=44386 RepID=A0A9J6FLX9_HAELO|nr:hypothetical protein HPB48_007226 [Haemaphysalis longicornis]